MGFDLYSLKREQEAPESYDDPYYFRANVWSWRPILAATLYATKIYEAVPEMTQEEYRSMSYNDFYEVSNERSLELSLALTHLVTTPEFVAELNGLPVNGVLLDGDNLLMHHGPWDDLKNTGISYAASLEHLIGFTNFCANSGGFAVG